MTSIRSAHYVAGINIFKILTIHWEVGSKCAGGARATQVKQ